MNCNYHIQKQVSSICLASHMCQSQRKLCVECLYDHGVDVIKQTVPIDRFGAMVIKKLKESKLDQTSELNIQKMNFKSMFSKFEIMMKKIWEDLAESIKQIYSMIEQENSQYINLINENQDPANSSYTDLEKLVQILNENTLDIWNAQKNWLLTKLEKAKDWLSQEVQAFTEKVKKEMNQFNLIDQSKVQSNIVQEIKPQVQSKNTDQIQIQSKQEQQQQQSLTNTQKLQENQIKSSQQFNLKPFSYQLMQQNSIKQSEFCYAVAFNIKNSIVATTCDEQIKIYEFKQGTLKQIQVLNEHKSNVTTLYFMKQQNQFISGDFGGSIIIWQSINNKIWNCLLKIKAHSNWIKCLFLNNKEDLFISSSNDNSIKFWIKKNGWICQQTINHTNMVSQLSLNDQQNKLITCGNDGFIIVIEYSQSNQKWAVTQKIKVECQGWRICFINDNQFTFQPKKGNQMDIYEFDSLSRQFTQIKHITLNTDGDDDCSLFPKQYFKEKQLLVVKHFDCINFIKKTENEQFKVQQSIQFKTNFLFGHLSDDGEYLITWDDSSEEIQIRKYNEK